MKKILSITVLFLIIGLQMCYAQKNQVSDYNLRKAYEMLDHNNDNETLKYVNQQIKDTPKLYEAYSLRAGIYYGQEKYGLALSDINTSIKYWNKKGNFAKYDSYWYRAKIYIMLDEFDKAIEEYNNIGKEYGMSKNLYYYKSYCYNEIGDTDRAIAEITKYIETGNSHDYYALGQRADYYR